MPKIRFISELPDFISHKTPRYVFNWIGFIFFLNWSQPGLNMVVLSFHDVKELRCKGMSENKKHKRNKTKSFYASCEVESYENV